MDDMISRQAAIDALLNLHGMVATDWHRDKDYFDAVSDAIAMLRNLPSVQPQRMRGKWIQADKNEPYFVQCSVCRYMTDNESDYCPNCGCDMRGTE